MWIHSHVMSQPACHFFASMVGVVEWTVHLSFSKACKCYPMMLSNSLSDINRNLCLLCELVGCVSSVCLFPLIPQLIDRKYKDNWSKFLIFESGTSGFSSKDLYSQSVSLLDNVIFQNLLPVCHFKKRWIQALRSLLMSAVLRRR